MAKKQSGLGRDFYSLLDDNNILGESKGTEQISIAKIEPRRDQPRKDFDQTALEALADSISVHGVIQPIAVRELEGEIFKGNYEIIAGERRWRAAKMAGLSEIPAIVISGDDLKVAQISLIENMQRMDLNAIEEAMAYKTLIEKYEMTQEELARQVGRSRPSIANTLRLLELPEDVQALLREGTLSMGHARALLGLEYEEDMVRLAQKTVEKGLSVREVEKIVKQTLAAAQDDGETTLEEGAALQRRVYMKDLEQKVMKAMGRKVRIHQTGRKQTVELTFTDDQDLEQLLARLAGEDIFS